MSKLRGYRRYRVYGYSIRHFNKLSQMVFYKVCMYRV